MHADSIGVLKAVKFAAAGLAVLMVAGIATIMFLARGTREDITGVVAPALLITLVSVVVAIVAAVQEKRERNVESNDDLTV